MSPSASIVVVNFNYARYLSRSIGSALRQGADEVLVVDDGSCDGSGSVIEEFGGDVRTLFKQNGGHVSAVNGGFAATTGELVIFLDADDTLLDGCLDAVKCAWLPGASKVQWGQYHIDSKGVRTGGIYPRFTKRHTPDWCRREMQRQCWYDAPPTSGNAWSREFLSQLMPLPQLGSRMWALDDYLHLLAPYSGEVVSLTEPLGEYRLHLGQMSGFSRFSPQTHANLTWDEVTRYEAVNAILCSKGIPPLDVTRWSQHTLNRIFARRLGLTSERLVPLLPRHIWAVIRSDTPWLNKAENALLGLVVAASGRGATERLAHVKYGL